MTDRRLSLAGWRESLAGASDLLSHWRALLAVSRPRTWLSTAIPFLVGAVEVQRGLSPAIILGIIYFLGPYHLLVNGETALSGALAGASIAQRRIAIALTNLPLLIVIVLLAGATAGLGLTLAVAAAVASTVPPLHVRERALRDALTGALQVVVPAVCGFLVAGRALEDVPWPAIVAFTLWVIASQALRAIGTVGVDRDAGPALIASILGGRVTAALSIGGYLLAAAIVATLGPLGVVAAFGLILYALLPVMILASPRDDPEPERSAARRAWAGFLGLDILVGLWLAQLLLRQWGLVTVSAFSIALWASAIILVYAVLDIVATRLSTRRRVADDRTAAHAAVPSLTIVVAVRDGAATVVDTIDALCQQTYADGTILVVDDGSTDGSAAIAAARLGRAGTVIKAPPRPPGWTARSWARHVGVETATTDLVLFVDADTHLVPVAARILVEQFQLGRYELLSGVPGYDMPTRAERAAVPGFPLLLFGFVPVWLSAVTSGRPAPAAFAYGPLLLVQRAAYQACGGLAAKPATAREDVELAHTFARAGQRIGTVHAADLATTRRYRTVRATMAGWRRSLIPNAGGSLAGGIATIALELLVFVVPFVLPPFAILSHQEPRSVIVSFVPLALLLVMRLALTLTQRQSAWTILWHPVTVVLTLVGQLLGIVDHLTGRGLETGGTAVLIPEGLVAEGSVPEG